MIYMDLIKTDLTENDMIELDLTKKESMKMGIIEIEN